MAVAYQLAGAIPTVQALAGEAGQWHLLPVDLLKNDLLRSLYDLHAQPPLYNFWTGLFAKLFYPAHLQVMVWPQIAMGGLVSVMSYALVLWWTRRRRLAVVAGLLLALNPALFLYEPLGYEMLTVFGVTMTVFLFALFDRTKVTVALVLAMVALTLTTLTRSAYHPILLAPVIALASAAAGTQWRRVLVAGLILCLLPLAWSAKNQTRFGFFGMSSWAGQNVWKIAALNYSQDELERFAREGLIEPNVTQVTVFHLPEDYRAIGFVQQTGRPALDGNNRNNINIIGVSQMYGRNAMRLVRHEPAHYAANVIKAYRLFCQPTNNAFALGDNRLFIIHNALSSEVVQGRAFNLVTKRLIGQDWLFTFWIIGLPGLFLWYAAQALRNYRRVPYGIHATALLAGYTVAVSCLLEYGENDRFKFTIEPLLWVMVVIVLASFLKRRSHERNTGTEG